MQNNLEKRSEHEAITQKRIFFMNPDWCKDLSVFKHHMKFKKSGNRKMEKGKKKIGEWK
jgi:hypothetical protein